MNSARIRTGAVAALAVCAAGATVAVAAPKRTTKLGNDTLTYSWEGGPVSGTPLVSTVDDSLVELTAEGALTVTVAANASTSPAADLDVDLYKSDKDGAISGDPLVSGAEAGNDEKVTAKNLKTGFYVVRVSAWSGVQEGFDGKASLAPTETAPAPGEAPPGETPPGSETPPPAPTAAPAADQTPDATITKASKRSFSGTATDDKGVARVEVALVKAGKKGKCTQLTSTKRKFGKLGKCAAPTKYLTAKGTTSWSLTLRKPLKKGRYTLYARAVDSAGQAQAGYAAANRRAFKIR